MCTNYRPVSLLSIINKVSERSVLNNIYNSLMPLLTTAQHGFLRGKSVNTQMLSIFDKINNVFDNNTPTYIYLDFSNSFDSVSHSLLLHKLKQFALLVLELLVKPKTARDK